MKNKKNYEKVIIRVKDKSNNINIRGPYGTYVEAEEIKEDLESKCPYYDYRVLIWNLRTQKKYGHLLDTLNK